MCRKTNILGSWQNVEPNFLHNTVFYSIFHFISFIFHFKLCFPSINTEITSSISFTWPTYTEDIPRISNQDCTV